MQNKTNTPELNRPKKQGRPSFDINWPEGSFTAKELGSTLKEESNVSLSNVSVQLKINKALSGGVLEKVGKKSNSIGRPTIVYRRRSES